MLSPICAVRKVTVFRDGNHNPGATISTSVNSAMRAPYGLTILDNCVTCPVREEHLFCNLPPPAVKKLNATKSNHPYEVTAEMIEPGQANFITRDALLQFLREYGEVALRVAEQLSRNYYTAYEEIRTLGLASSPAEKFAKLLLSWESKKAGANGTFQIKLTLTHEEIAEMIGTTRETVSRLFSDFKKKQLLQLKGSTLIVRNKPALEKMVHP